MNNKLMNKVKVLAMAVVVSVSVVGCGDVKVGGEKLPLSGIEEFESYQLNGNYSSSKCVGCAKKKQDYNTNIGPMCSKCYKRYEKYLNKLAKRTQTCGKCNNVPTIVIESDRYHNPTVVSCETCVEVYETEAIDRAMEETIKRADLEGKFKREAEKCARQDARAVKGLPVEEQEAAFMNATENFVNTVVAKYVLSTTEQEAMMYIYMNEFVEALQ